jgi:hypothetical protein
MFRLTNQAALFTYYGNTALIRSGHRAGLKDLRFDQSYDTFLPTHKEVYRNYEAE